MLGEARARAAYDQRSWCTIESHLSLNFLSELLCSIDLAYSDKVSESSNAIFTFDRVFTPKNSQKDLFDHIVAPLVTDTLNGFNCTVIAYGQTGSGKTHTMEGPPNVSYDGEEAGVLPRVADTLFSTINATKEGEGTAFSYSVTMSVIEIYLERIVDLLDNSPPLIGKKTLGNDMLRIREDAAGGVYLEGVVEQMVHNPRDLLKCLDTAGKKRR